MSENQQHNVIEEYQPERIPELEAEGIQLSSCLKCKKLGYDLRSRERYDVDEFGFFKIRYLHPKGQIIQRDAHTNEIIKTTNVEEEIHEVGTAIGLDMSFKVPSTTPGIPSPVPIPKQKQVQTKIEPESITIPELIKEVIAISEKSVEYQHAIQSNLRLLATKWEEFEFDAKKKLNPQLAKHAKSSLDRQFRRGVRSDRDVVKCPKHGKDSYEYRFYNKGTNQEGFYYVHKGHSPNDRCSVIGKNVKPLSPKTLQLYRGRRSKAVSTSSEKVKQLLEQYDMIKYLHKQKEYPKIVKCPKCKREATWAITPHISRDDMIKYIQRRGRLPPLIMDFNHKNPRQEHTTPLIGSIDDMIASLPQ